MDEENKSKKIWTIAALLIVLALVAGVWIGRPAYHRYKETHGLKQARAALAKKDYRNLDLSLRTVLAINPANLEAVRLMADLADEARSPAALVWRRRLAELSPTLNNKIIMAACALRFEPPPFAFTAQTLEEIRPAAETNTSYHLVASQLAIKLNRLPDAETHLRAAAALQPTNRLHQLNLATIRLQSAETNTADAARRELAALAEDSVLGAHALRSLVADGVVRRQFAEAQNFSRQLLQRPQATFDDRLQQLTILSGARSAELGEWLGSAEAEAATNTIKSALLVSWLTAHDSAREALNWLASLPAPAPDTLPVPLVEADAYVALRDWKGLETRLDGQRWKEQDFLRLALLARASREQGQRDTSNSKWRLAVNAATAKSETLAVLAQVAGSWGWQGEVEDLLWVIVQRSPGAEWALKNLLQGYAAKNDTPGLYRVYQALLKNHPQTVELKNNVAMFGLLLNRDRREAGRLAREVYEAGKTNALLLSTHAFALHTQGKTAEGLKLMQTLPESELLRPNIALYYAVLLAATGDVASAKTYLDAAEKSPMLPEERRLLEQARRGN